MLATWALALGLGCMPSPPPSVPKPGPGDGDARVSVWTDRGTPYRSGDAVRAFASTRVDGYLTVFRIDTDGGLSVLYPREPWEEGWVRGGRVVQLDDAPGASAFLVDDYAGVGYLFAVTSPDPFDYSSIVRRDQWDYREIDNGRIHGDPYVALTDLAERIAPGGAYDYDITPYYVQRHYDYPRFVCYDCHTSAPYTGWDPYRSTCTRYRIVVYDDPYYYPYQAYGGRAVVAGRPPRLAPRYVFEAADGRTPWLTRAHRASEESEPPYRDRAAKPARDWRAEPRERWQRSSPAETGRSTGEPELRRRKPAATRKPEPVRKPEPEHPPQPGNTTQGPAPVRSP